MAQRGIQAVSKTRFVPRKYGRQWEVYDLGRYSIPGAIPGFGRVPVHKTEEACQDLCEQLEGFCLENPKAWPAIKATT